jgi:hypothetical protein
MPGNVTVEELLLEDVAWAAGFLDGEAWFGLVGSRGSPSPTIQAAQVASAEPLRVLARLFGGNVVHYSPPSRPRGAWHWRIYGAERVRRALVFVLPYLTAKREDAERLLNYTLCVRPKHQRGPQRYEPLHAALRDELARRVRERGA